jgi:predicted extracellular nuclease
MVFNFYSCSEKKRENQKNMTVVFYNVENLFDLEDEPEKVDEEFLPDGDKKWNSERYTKKLEDIAKVLSLVNEKELPEIIGLCEVENNTVLADLVQTGQLKNGDYKIVHHESPDFRGIDCALIYRPDEFKLLEHAPIAIRFENEPDYKTRDVLYVKGRTKNRERFHIFVNHWPSRIGGLEKTEPYRVHVATVVKHKIDSIVKVDSKAKIIVMGDMNDEPANNSLLHVLEAKTPGTESAKLRNLMFPLDEEGKGTYNFRGDWNMLDNLVVSDNLLDDKGFRVVDKQGYIFQQEWMEFKNQEGIIYPNRTYGGPNYYGGTSDHFPVYFRLQR